MLTYAASDRMIASHLAALLERRSIAVYAAGDHADVRAIEEATLFLVILSDAAVESAWFRRDVACILARAARDPRVLVVPILTHGWSGTKPTPFSVSVWQSLSLPGDGSVDELADTVATRLAPPRGPRAGESDRNPRQT